MSNDTLPTGAENTVWDLTHLYAGIDDPAIDSDLNRADGGADELDEQFRGRIATLSPAGLSDLLKSYEEIAELAGKVGTFAYLNWAANTSVASHGAL